MAQFGNIYTDANGTEYTKHPVARVSKVKDDAHIYDLVDTGSKPCSWRSCRRRLTA